MARIEPETLDRLARLARLSLSDDERATFAPQLEQILAYAESMSGSDEDAAAPDPLPAPPLRDDAAREGLAREQALAAAPDAAAGLFRVPRVLGG